MTTIWKRSAAIGALGVVLIVVGCESGTEPWTPIVPEQTAAADLLGGTLGGTLGSELSFANRTIARLSDEVVRKKIDSSGGSLELLGHTLTVPEGAVDRPTMFVMAVLAGSAIQVELIAYDPDLYEDVGGKGFKLPVQLALSYAEVDGADPDRLTIVHIKSDGERVPLETTPIEGTRQVAAWLTHFSRYGLCTN